MHLPTPIRLITLAALSLVLFNAGSLRAGEDDASAADEAGPTAPAPDLPKASPETIAKAVEARRGKTELSKLAASMEPGTWAELKHEMPKGIWAAPGAKHLHIGTWSDDGHWDSRTGQFVYFGVRQVRKLIAYSEETNTWRNIPFDGKPNAPALNQQFGHQYSNNSHDPERSCYYTGTYRYDIVNDAWAQLPPVKIGSKFMTFEFFTAMDGVLCISRQPEAGAVCFYSNEKKTWTKLGVTPVHGYHSMARHNPFKQEVLLAGGNDCRAVVILKKNGTLKRMKDFPLEVDKFTVRATTITVDPLSGRYLIMVPGNKFVEFDSEANEYRLIDDFTQTPWPFYKYDGTVTAFIPEYGVTFWADAQKVHLYKHKPCTGAPLEPAPAGATANAGSKGTTKGEEK